MRVIIRAWTKDEFHKDIAVLDDKQVRMLTSGMECKTRHVIPPLNANRVVIDPAMFPDAIEFEVIVE